MQARRMFPRAGRQHGVTLIIVLLILVVVTILGIGGAQIALLGERSTRYDRDYLIASQAAEAALMDAEIDIRGRDAVGGGGGLDIVGTRMADINQDNTGIFAAGCSSNPATRGLCLPNADAVRPVWAEVDFLDEDAATARTAQIGQYTGLVFDAGSAGIKPARKPRYIVEVVDDSAGGNNAKFEQGKSTIPKMYRITSMGFGPRPDIQVVMQTTYRKKKD